MGTGCFHVLATINNADFFPLLILNDREIPLSFVG